MKLTKEDIDSIERWWIEKSRVNFFAYRKFMNYGTFLHNWFVEDLCRSLQNFYKDLRDGKRPTLLIQSPPQHGKSVAIMDFIPWISGLIPSLRTIYASYSENLGIRCNTYVQRQVDSEKYCKIFPGTCINESNVLKLSDKPRRNSYQIEYVDKDGKITGGYFRNTTVSGKITGESLDLGIIDDAVKGREEANSTKVSEKIWDWYNDDFSTRFSEFGGLIIIMTRWSTHDIIGRILDSNKKVTLVNYQAIATEDEKHRKSGDALFPKLKSKDFLLDKKATMSSSSWESLYQGNPTVTGGNIIKDSWYKWWVVLPSIKYKFIVADTAQKTKTHNDYTDFKCFGVGREDGNLYLLDHFRSKLTAPELRLHAEIFYKKHDKPRVNINDPILRCMYIEDKSSGIGLIQELRAKNMKIKPVSRSVDKILRAEDASPYIEAGRVYLNKDIYDIDNTLKETREFPNSAHDDDIDTLITAIEVTYINKLQNNPLLAAMEAV